MHPWADRDEEIVDLRISPEGTRAAVVVESEDDPAQLYIAGVIRDEDSQPQALGNTFRLQTDEPPNQVSWYSTAEILAGRVSARDRVELELIGFSGPSVSFKPMLGMINFPPAPATPMLKPKTTCTCGSATTGVHNPKPRPNCPTRAKFSTNYPVRTPTTLVSGMLSA